MPMDALPAFETYALRYIQTMIEHPPGVPVEFFVCLMNAPKHYDRVPNFTRLKQIKGLTMGQINVQTGGLDIGCAQEAAQSLCNYDFAVFSTSRVYFHREGWLRRLVEAQQKYGANGLYGATGSYEACPVDHEKHAFPNPHLRTVLYGCHPNDLAQFPHKVTDRITAHQFEAGAWNFAKWMLFNHRPVKMVTWDWEFDLPQWRYPKNIFRRGDQSNILCWDKHSDHYRDAPPTEKDRLQKVTG